jgi:secreted trypsin-like serine protease
MSNTFVLTFPGTHHKLYQLTLALITVIIAGCRPTPPPVHEDTSKRGSDDQIRSAVLAYQQQVRDLNRTRVAGGQPAKPGELPWQAALVSAGWAPKDGVFCGGTVIAPRWIVTAAHCFPPGTEETDQYVFVGPVDLTQRAEGEELGIDRIYPYPRFNWITLDSDLALLWLKKDVTKATPVDVLDPKDAAMALAPRRKGRVSGWGQIAEDKAKSVQLRYVDVPVVEQKKCAENYSKGTQKKIVTPNMLCAGSDLSDQGDACFGDSGGPFIVPDANGNKFKLAGTVSWGTGCSRAGLYGVYTRMPNYIPWIEAYLRKPTDELPTSPKILAQSSARNPQARTAEKSAQKPEAAKATTAQLSGDLISVRPEWMIHIDWSIRNTDAGGSTNCPGLYPYPGCVLRGGRACLMSQAINSAKAGSCSDAFRVTLVTQCHNKEAQQAIQSAGPTNVCSYLKSQSEETEAAPNTQPATPKSTTGEVNSALTSNRPEWMVHVDWSMRNTDAGGSTNCPDLYAYPECVLKGGRACLMAQAINSAKAGSCSDALRATLITQCHNKEAQQAIEEAGSAKVCSYLKSQPH